MKKRSMILALASMLGISTAATAVSGFAWFTTQTTASITSSAFKVGASGENLIVKAVSANDVNCTSSGDANAIEVEHASTVLADVSSADGKSFYKLKDILNDPENDGTGTAYCVEEDNVITNKLYMSVVKNTQAVCISWTVEVQNGEEDDGQADKDVFLSSSNSNLFVKTGGAAEEDDYFSAYRMVILDEEDNLLYFYSKSTTALTTTGTISYTSGKNELKGNSNAITGNQTSVTKITSKENATETQKLLTLSAAEKQEIKFVVWCEGTQTPNEEVNSSNKVDLEFNLIGFDVE